jgi:Ser/Thr protein kinase RdoA (MazF antagonist)
MSYDELRHDLTHRTDKAALQADWDRHRELAPPMVTTIDEPDLDHQIESAISQWIEAHKAQRVSE